MRKLILLVLLCHKIAREGKEIANVLGNLEEFSATEVYQEQTS